MNYNSGINTKDERVPSLAQILHRVIIRVFIHIYNDGEDTHNNYVQTITGESTHKIDEPFVISSANASSQPHTMMIKI